MLSISTQKPGNLHFYVLFIHCEEAASLYTVGQSTNNVSLKLSMFHNCNYLRHVKGKIKCFKIFMIEVWFVHFLPGGFSTLAVIKTGKLHLSGLLWQHLYTVRTAEVVHIGFGSWLNPKYLSWKWLASHAVSLDSDFLQLA